MKRRINICILGLGNMGRLHLEGYLRLGKENVLVSVVENNSDTLRELSEVDKYTNIEQLPSIGDMDIFDICLPTYSHYKIIELLTKIKTKKRLFIFCEKPLVTNLSQAKKIENLLRRNKRIKIFPAMVERFNPIFVELKKIYKKNKKLDTYLIIERDTIDFKKLKGKDFYNDIIWDLGVHDVDILDYIFEDDFNKFNLKIFLNNSISLKLESNKIKIEIILSRNLPSNHFKGVRNKISLSIGSKKYVYDSEDSYLISDEGAIKLPERYPNSYFDEVREIVTMSKYNKKNKIFPEFKNVVKTTKMIEKIIKLYEKRFV